MPPLYDDTGPALQVCGYCSVFNCDYSIGDGKLERVNAGAFDLSAPIYATFLHDDGPRFARSWDRTLRTWQDDFGLGFSFDLPSSWNGVALARSISAGTFRSASVNFTSRTVEQRVEHGRTVEVVTAATIDELSICPSGACPLACVWHSGEELSALPPFVATSRARWAVGRMGLQVAANNRATARAKHHRPPDSVMKQVDRCLAMAARTRR